MKRCLPFGPLRKLTMCWSRSWIVGQESRPKSATDFEPFFTTKQQNEGTGLGLDLVFRIVRKHHGDIRFESRPGRTCFQVRLPLKKNQDSVK